MAADDPDQPPPPGSGRLGQASAARLDALHQLAPDMAVRPLRVFHAFVLRWRDA
jgi:hypothetical protein